MTPVLAESASIRSPGSFFWSACADAIMKIIGDMNCVRRTATIAADVYVSSINPGLAELLLRDFSTASKFVLLKHPCKAF